MSNNLPGTHPDKDWDDWQESDHFLDASKGTALPMRRVPKPKKPTTGNDLAEQRPLGVSDIANPPQSDPPLDNTNDELRKLVHSITIGMTAEEILPKFEALFAHSNQALIDKALEALPEKEINSPLELENDVTSVAYKLGWNSGIDQCRRVIEDMKYVGE